MNDIQAVTKTLSERERLSAIFWLIIGILQCLSCFCIFTGAYNIYVATTRFKQADAVLQPWPGIVQYYDNSQTNIIIGLVVNLVFGGVIGVAASLYDMFAIRDYVLKNRHVFEQAGL